jgi:hypothetical protein
MDTYKIGNCICCGKVESLKDGICPVCDARKQMEQEGEIPDLLKEIFG